MTPSERRAAARLSRAERNRRRMELHEIRVAVRGLYVEARARDASDAEPARVARSRLRQRIAVGVHDESKSTLCLSMPAGLDSAAQRFARGIARKRFGWSTRARKATRRRAGSALARMGRRARRHADRWMPAKGCAGPAVLLMLHVERARSPARATRRSVLWHKGKPPFYGRTAKRRRRRRPSR